MNLPRPRPLLPALLALFLLPFSAPPLRAALPEPPPLPFPLPAAPDLRVSRTTTLHTPDRFLHVASLSRPLAPFELDDLSASLAQRRWQPQIADSPPTLDALLRLQSLAPSPELRQPFDALLQLLRDGAHSWTLDALQLLYAPGPPATLCLSFPMPSNSLPASPGAYTADLPLPLHDARLAQAAIQAEDAQITRSETWLSPSPPELFLPQTEPLLLAAGWTPPSPSAPPPVSPNLQSARAQLLFMETLAKSLFRVYHRGTSQLSLLHLPPDASDPAAPPHTYVFILRTPLQWPPSPP